MADYDEVIPPGQEGKINVKLIGSKLHPGRFEKAFSVKTNDPENAKVTLKVIGNIEKVLEQSKELSISGYKGDDFSDEVILTTLIDTPINLTGYHWSDKGKDHKVLDENIEVKIVSIEPGKKHKLEVRLKKELPPKHYFADLLIETDFEKLPEKKLAFRLQIMDDVELHPSAVYMREMSVPDGTTRNFEKAISVISARGDSLKVLDVIPSDESITWNIREIKPGKAYQIKFQVRPPSEPGRYEASLKVKTNYKGYEELTVPIIGAVRIAEDGGAKQ